MSVHNEQSQPESALKLVGSGRDQLRVLLVGHADKGESALAGWLFRDAGSSSAGSQSRIKTEVRDYAIIDVSGHRDFIENLVTGAADADAALLVVDAADGVDEQSRRHGYLMHLLGVRQILVAVNNMDTVGYERSRFEEIEKAIRAYLAGLGVEPTGVAPVAALEGDNIVSRSNAMSWYSGPILFEALDALAAISPETELPLRMPVQDVQDFDNRRVVAGRIESGRISVGDELIFSPSNKTARVATLEEWPQQERSAGATEATAGQSVGLTLDEEISVERGELASHIEDAPVETEVFKGRIFWLGKEPLAQGKRYRVKLGTCEANVRAESIERLIDPDDLSTADAEKVEQHQVAEVVFRARRMLALDQFADLARTGRFAIVDDEDAIVGGGVISMEGYADQRDLITQRATNITRVSHGVSSEKRERQNGHKGGVLWLTGLSGAGKSTLAVALEERLYDLGYQTFVLDGDNVRHGLNANLGFSPEDRAENIRRVGEVAALFAGAGMISITAFISPYRSDRKRAREAAGERYHEIHIHADLETCEERDPKGLYKKARAGEIADFTGISAPYEAPEQPELVVDTSRKSVEECLDELVSYVKRNFILMDRT